MIADLAKKLEKKTAGELKSDCEKLVLAEKKKKAELIAHLAEIGDRKAHLDWGYKSLFEYCARGLNLAEGSVWTRLQVAGVCKRFPEALEALVQGSHSLTVLGLLSRHLNEANPSTLLEETAYKSKREVQEILVRYQPTAENAPSIRKAAAESRGGVESPTQSSAAEPKEVTPLQFGRQNPTGGDNKHTTEQPSVAATPKASALPNSMNTTNLAGSQAHHSSESGSSVGPYKLSGSKAKNQVSPATTERFNFKFAGSRAFKEKLERLAEVMGYENAVKHLETIMDEAVEAALEKKDPARKEARRKKRDERKQKRAEQGALTQKDEPKKSKTPNLEKSKGQNKTQGRSRYIPTRERAKALERAGYRCEHRGVDGRRCSSRANLQVDHIVPFAEGGPHNASNLQVLCSAHNLRKAEHDFSEAFIRGKIANSQSVRAKSPRPDEVKTL